MKKGLFSSPRFLMPHTTSTYQKRIGRCKLGDLMWFIKPYHKHRETGDDSGSQVNPIGNLEFIELRKNRQTKRARR